MPKPKYEERHASVLRVALHQYRRLRKFLSFP